MTKVDDDDATIEFPDGVEHSGLYSRADLHDQLVSLVTAWAEQAGGETFQHTRGASDLLDFAESLGLCELAKANDLNDRVKVWWLSDRNPTA